jgi:glyoxylase-like metal-dependent hydrolase (beta-lactamase superfamily II)
MAQADPAAPTIETLADGAWARQAIDNMTWFDMGDHLIVVDALEETALEEEVLVALEKTCPGKRVGYVLNTHTHYDHVALNKALAQWFKAEIVNLKTCRIPEEGLWFEGRDRRLLLKPKPGCHTNTDCVVWSPDDKVLCVGDLFGWGLIPLTTNLTDRTVGRLMGVYKDLIAYEAETVVPGHGPLCTTDELRRFVRFFGELRDEVAAAVAAGRSDEEILTALAPPDDMRDWWRFADWKYEDSLKKMLKPVRKGKLE